MLSGHTEAEMHGKNASAMEDVSVAAAVLIQRWCFVPSRWPNRWNLPDQEQMPFQLWECDINLQDAARGAHLGLSMAYFGMRLH